MSTVAPLLPLAQLPLLAQLPRAGAAVVWLIVLGGLGTFIWRRIQGIPLRSERNKASESTGPAEPVLPSSLPPLVPPVAPTAPFAGSSEPSFPPLSSPAPDPSTTAPATSSGNRGGFFAPVAGADDDPARATGDGRATVGEAVRGITMPCGLTPVIDGVQSIPNPFRAAFLTTTADAATVGAGLADELERLGFTLSTSTPTELLARRDTIELRVVLYVSPATAQRGLDRIFPAAPPGSVGVELIT
jgi:hypothetical protein